MNNSILMKASLVGLAISDFIVPKTFAADLPLVFEKEFSGEACTKPKVPTLAEAKAYAMLPDPFAKADGSGRIKSFSEWACRRAEMKAQIETIEVGIKPPRPSDIKATYSGGTLTVTITNNGKSMTLTSKITLPSGAGPFPAIIGFDSPSGSLPAMTFSSRNIAQIPFTTRQVTVDGQRKASDPFYTLYPELAATHGQYSAWNWGVSRLIDGLELVKDQLPIDTKHLAVTGCSRWGKGALWSGAFDERIALTLPQEAGGGGTAAWRVSETIGKVENLGATDKNWFQSTMFAWAGSNVPKLPHDHHFLLGMIAPRAVLVIGNGAMDYEWLAEQSGYVSSRAGEEIYKALGIPDRMGFSHSGHTHCGFPTNQQKELDAFVDKFLLGKTANTTGISTNPFANVDYNKWITDWKGQTISADVTGIEKSVQSVKDIRCFVKASPSKIILEAQGKFSYQLMTYNGQLMASGQAENKAALNADLQKGVYLAKITQNHQSTVVRFIYP